MKEMEKKLHTAANYCANANRRISKVKKQDAPTRTTANFHEETDERMQRNHT